MCFKFIFKTSILSASIALIGCAANESILRSNSNEPVAESTVASNSKPVSDTAESEVENMRTADFDFIYVFRRKDGGVMQADDKAFVRTATANVNRRSLVDGGKAIVIGANAGALGDMIKALSQRFDVQDFSKPGVENTNSNKPANANIVR